MYPQVTLQLARSASDQNTVLTYVCLINDINPSGHSSAAHMRHKIATPLDVNTAQEDDTDDEHLQVERSKALHELVESHKNSNVALDVNRTFENYLHSPMTSSEEDNDSQNATDSLGNPNLLKLTKMKWLTENKDDAPDSSSPSITPTSSSTSLSNDSQTKLDHQNNLNDKYLSTILRLDKEHNLFGLSNIAIVGSRTSKKTRKEDDKPVFPQTAIVQICCRGSSYCNNRSQTDLPASLKCGGCKRCTCCYSGCSVCSTYIPPCCKDSCVVYPCKKKRLSCGGCKRYTCCYSGCSVCSTYIPPCCKDSCVVYPCKKKRLSPCSSISIARCIFDCHPCSLKLALNTKPKFDPVVVEVTPRSSCILQKPMSARPCEHIPRCIPPSCTFPYLMPCYWPARESAPCTHPARCFHKPPCMPPRKPKSRRPSDACPRVGKCTDRGNKCPSHSCPGNIPDLKKAIEDRFG